MRYCVRVWRADNQSITALLYASSLETNADAIRNMQKSTRLLQVLRVPGYQTTESNMHWQFFLSTFFMQKRAQQVLTSS